MHGRLLNCEFNDFGGINSANFCYNRLPNGHAVTAPSSMYQLNKTKKGDMCASRAKLTKYEVAAIELSHVEFGFQKPRLL